MGCKLWKKATEEEVLSEVCNSGMLKARLSQLLSVRCKERGRASKDVLLNLFGYRRLVSTTPVTSDMNVTEKKEKIAQALEKLLDRWRVVKDWKRHGGGSELMYFFCSLRKTNMRTM